MDNKMEIIYLPLPSVEVIEDVQRKVVEVNAEIRSYAAGLRHGLQVPKDWQLDIEKKRFSPPVGEEKEGDVDIPIPEKSWQFINEAHQNLVEINSQLNRYVSGLRHGLNVPDDWVLDMEKKAFVARTQDE